MPLIMGIQGYPPKDSNDHQVRGFRSVNLETTATGMVPHPRKGCCCEVSLPRRWKKNQRMPKKTSEKSCPTFWIHSFFLLAKEKRVKNCDNPLGFQIPHILFELVVEPPSWKYARQNGSFPQFSGWKYTKYLKTPPSFDFPRWWSELEGHKDPAGHLATLNGWDRDPEVSGNVHQHQQQQKITTTNTNPNTYIYIYILYFSRWKLS